MATYQFRLNLIPRKGIIDEFGFIPNKLYVNYKERSEHYYLKQENLLESTNFFLDALTINFWNSVNILPIEITHYINKLFPRKPETNNADYYYWKHYKRTHDTIVDNDALLILNEKSHIKELYFRADLRENDLEFLNKFIEIAKKYDCLLMDLHGNLILPERKEVYKLINLSSSYKFLTNLESFFVSLVENNSQNN